MKHLFTLLLFVLFTTVAYAQKLKNIEGEYTYHAPENVSLEQAKTTALDRAKIQALADEFGTIVSQYNTTIVENNNEQSNIDFSSIGGSEVKGEWIETLGEPIYNIMYEGDMFVVSVKVKGKAREITSAGIDFKAHVLKNGIEDRFESDLFVSGDDLYVSFRSPVKGFLAIYLMDANKQAYCLLPYRGQQDGIYAISANRRYLFFNENTASEDEQEMIEEYVMTCEQQTEKNNIYVIFSPNKFIKANDNDKGEALPRELTHDAFQKWLTGCRKHDEKLSVQMFPITIKSQ